ncbi:MAG: DUF2807 domain-containing protein [Bacteroidales bacterium]|nr:DUF2807 domain-containing protein [Bacteroidales bacterium]
MKRILLTALAVMLAAATAFAGTFSNKYNLSGFTGIKASSLFHVELSPSSTFSVSIEAPDYLEQYIVAEVSHGQLVLRMKDLPNSVQRKLSDERSGVIRADMSMPLLESVSLSGAAALNVNGAFPALRNGRFLLDMSGATHAKGLSLSGPEADISLSGAAEADLAGDFDEVSLDISGAGKIKLDSRCPELDAELSGSARADLKGSYREVSIEASGAARVDIESADTLHELDIEGSGAASIDTRSAKANEVTVELSGAANCKVSAIRRISVEATGASTCSYEAEADTRVDVIQVARGASLRKL